MMKKIVCFTGALALMAGTAFAQTRAEKDREIHQDRQDVRKDRKAVRKDRHEVREDRHDVRRAEPSTQDERESRDVLAQLGRERLLESRVDAPDRQRPVHAAPLAPSWMPYECSTTSSTGAMRDRPFAQTSAASPVGEAS